MKAAFLKRASDLREEILVVESGRGKYKYVKGWMTLVLDDGPENLNNSAVDLPQKELAANLSTVRNINTFSPKEMSDVSKKCPSPRAEDMQNIPEII